MEERDLRRWARALTVGVSLGVVTGWLGLPGESMVTGLVAGAGVGLAVGVLAALVSGLRG